MLFTTNYLNFLLNNYSEKKSLFYNSYYFELHLTIREIVGRRDISLWSFEKQFLIKTHEGQIFDRNLFIFLVFCRIFEELIFGMFQI